MNEIVINQTTLTAREYSGQYVLTFRDIDTVHQRPDGTARRNFNENKQHFIENVDYFIVKPSDVQMYEIRTSEINNRGTTLVTETGYLMIVKSFTDDLAWAVQRQLVNAYFRNRIQTADLSALAERIGQLEERLSRIESKSVPDRDEQEIRLALDFMESECVPRPDKYPYADGVTITVMWHVFRKYCLERHFPTVHKKNFLKAVCKYFSVDFSERNSLLLVRNGYRYLPITVKEK